MMPAIQISHEEKGERKVNEVRRLRRLSSFSYNKKGALKNRATIIFVSYKQRKANEHI